ncbi:hypothetical protein GCM10029964_052090 [Kibdelosporangium lantanae]
MSDPQRPTLLTKLRAKLGGEQDATILEALRQAGRSVYHELVVAEKLRAELVGTGATIWTAPTAVSSQLLATWNAYVLQSLGEQLLDADYTANPSTVGYVPTVIFDQVSSWFGGVESWLSLARQARHNPDYDLTAVLALPAPLPPWAEVEPCPPEHLWAILAAIPPVRHQAEVAVHALEGPDLTKQQQKAVNRLKQMAAEAGAALDYALGLRSARHDARLHELIENNLKSAMEIWFTIGQLAAAPALIERYLPRRAPARPDLNRLPGGNRFNPWCLTDPVTLGRWQRDSRAKQAISEMWQYDPDPAATLAIKDEIDAALAAGDIAHMRIHGGGTCYYECPWPALYEVRRPVRIAGRQLHVMQQFTFRVSADEVFQRNGTFAREIVTGPFQPTNDIDYCDPDGMH